MQIAAAILFVAAAVAFRLVTGMPGAGDPAGFANFAPMVGVVFCSALVLPARMALPVSFGSLFLSDLVLNAQYARLLGGESAWSLTFSLGTLAIYSIYAIIFVIGASLSKGRGVGALFAGTIGGVFAFYILSNTMSWAASPGPAAGGYAKSLAGWFQAQTTGLPGFAPSYVFLRNQLIGNTVFAAFFAVLVLARREPGSAGMRASTASEA